MDKIKGDFRNFMYLVWKEVIPGRPDPTPIQYDIAHFVATGANRRAIQAYRGAAKTYITATYVVWRLLNDPSLKVKIVSANSKFSKEISTFIKQIIYNVPACEGLRGGRRDSVESFDVRGAPIAKDPSVSCIGITGQLTGSRADILISDDVEVPNNSKTVTAREELRSLTGEYASLLTHDKAEIIYLGTPQTEDSIYKDLPSRGYEVRVWTALYPDTTQAKKYGDRLAPYIWKGIEEGKIGLPVEPERFTMDNLMARKLDQGASQFQLQYMLDTSLSDEDKYPLKLHDLVVMDINNNKAPVSLAWCNADDKRYKTLQSVGLDGDFYYQPMMIDDYWSEYEDCVMAIDPSGRGADRTTYAIIKFLGGNMYLVDFGSLAGGYSPEVMKEIATKAKKFEANTIYIESNFGDGTYAELLKPHVLKIHSCNIEEFRVHTQKERRIISTLEPVMNQHRLIVSRELIERDLREDLKHQLFYQMTRLTKDPGSLKHDDAIDVLSMAVQYFSDRMNRDAEIERNAAHEAWLEDQLSNFMDNALGRSSLHNHNAIHRKKR